MPKLLVKFRVRLVESDPDAIAPHGPLFTKWLPNGQKGAIALEISEPDIALSVWFERRGFVGQDGYIHFDPLQQDVPVAVMERQAILDAGSLNGLVEMMNVEKNQFDAVTNGLVGSEPYTRLAKYVVQKVLYILESQDSSI